jgi:hypothetical protein
MPGLKFMIHRWSGFYLLIVVALCLTSISACQSEVERLQGESIFYLDQAVKILERVVPDTNTAIRELDKYMVDNRDRMLEAKARELSLMQKMTADEQARFKRRAAGQTRVLRERLDSLVRTFSDPPRVLMKIQQFL